VGSLLRRPPAGNAQPILRSPSAADSGSPTHLVRSSWISPCTEATRCGSPMYHPLCRGGRGGRESEPGSKSRQCTTRSARGGGVGSQSQNRKSGIYRDNLTPPPASTAASSYVSELAVARTHIASVRPNLVPCVNLVLPSLEPLVHTARALESCWHAEEGLPCCPVTSRGSSGAANGRAGEEYQVRVRYQLRAKPLLQTHTHQDSRRSPSGVWVQRNRVWPSQDIHLHRGCYARINHSFSPLAHLHCPPCCSTIARLLDSILLPF